MDRNLIFTRNLSTPVPPPQWPHWATVHLISSPKDPAFAALNGLYVQHHFRPDWATGLLKGTARAIAVTGMAGGSAVAAAWLVREPFYVSEMGRTFDPGPDGDYYFGDFVNPHHRGEGLHRWLILHRLALSAADGRRWAFAMSRDTNRGSCKNYPATGFKLAAELTTRRSRIISLDQLKHLDISVPFGQLSQRGLPLPGGYRLRRVR
jgi:hypothetical protein